MKQFLPLVFLAWIVATVRADKVDEFVRNEMQSHRIPGVALKVIQNGKPIKTAAYGLANLELNATVKPETVFEIGSITKQFTAAGILLLAQEQKISVDDIPSGWKILSPKKSQ